MHSPIAAAARTVAGWISASARSYARAARDTFLRIAAAAAASSLPVSTSRAPAGRAARPAIVNGE